MSQTRFLRNVCYRKLLDKDAPIASYNLYEDDFHRFAFITFYNNSITTILSFKIKFTFFDEGKNRISTAAFEVNPPDFYSHHNYTLSEPLVMPKEADGFNYEIFDLKKVSSKDTNHKNVKIGVVPFKRIEHGYVKPKKNGNGKLGFVFPLISVALAACGVIPYFIKGITMGSFQFGASGNKYDVGQIVYDENGLELTYDDSNQFTVIGIDSRVSSDITISSNYDGIPISKIGSYAFSGNESIFNVYIDNENLLICDHAFSDCFRIKSLYGRVREIDKDAFSDCSDLIDVRLDYCSYISYGAFYNCKSLEFAYVSYGCDIESDAFPSWTRIERI